MLVIIAYHSLGLRASMVKALQTSGIDFGKCFVLFLPSYSISHTKAMIEDFSNIFELHAPDFRETEEHKDPAKEADRYVETKFATGCDTLHNGQEC
jgi:hypothetical protein